MRLFACTGIAAIIWSVSATGQTLPHVYLQGRSDVKFGSQVLLAIPGLKSWTPPAGKSAKDLQLILDGRPVPGLPLRFEGPELIEYDLMYLTDTNKPVWNVLLGSPTSLTRKIPVTIGLSGDSPFPSDDNLIFDVIEGKWLLVWLASVLFFFAVLLGARNILRDGGPLPADGRRTYSLAKCQMATWTFVILTAFIFLWLATTTTSALSATVLGLMGISSMTALGAVVIDNNKRNAAATASASPTPAPAPAKKESAPSSLGQFLDDILSDENGISLHRFQMLIWTLVLAVIFLTSVYRNLAMPDLDPSLLAVMGISSGTYLGFKFPEKL